jgi:calcineurin-like phosphoesterase family protein
MDRIHIDLQEGQKIWFTSDLHIGHRNIISFCNRPFTDTRQMAEVLRENWNSVVKPEDYVFVLGDVFWFNDSQVIKKYLASLVGKEIYIIKGNHDDYDGYHRVADPRIHLLSGEATLWITGKLGHTVTELYLSHCPMMTWPHRPSGVPNLFGHIHSTNNVGSGWDADLPLWKGLQYDIGVDNNEYTPIELDEVFRKLEEDRK